MTAQNLIRWIKTLPEALADARHDAQYITVHA